MAEPLLPWESEGFHPQLVWRSVLDKRYLVEVQRIDQYNAKLCVFDHNDGDKEIACWETTLSYGAIFGPDVDDVARWSEKVIKFVDKT